MKYLYLVLFVDLIVSEWSWGWCPDKKSIPENKNISLSQFNGTWYEIMRTKDDSNIGDCVTYDFAPTSEGNMLVMIKGINNSDFKSYNSTWRKNDYPTHFKVEIEPFLSRIYDKEYNIVNTDYEKYALLYACYDAALAKDEYVWILSRSPQMDTELLNNMTSYLFDKYEIKKDELITINQNNTKCKR